MELFHVHLLVDDVPAAEARHLAAGFRILQRTGWVDGAPVSIDDGTGWDELTRRGFRLRLVALERDGVEIVLQPGRWSQPRVDHVGVLVTSDEADAVLARADAAGLAVQERGTARTFVATGTGYRLELRPTGLSAPPPRPFAVELASAAPEVAAAALASLVGVEVRARAVRLGRGVVRVVPGGPKGRPALSGDDSLLQIGWADAG